MLADHLGSTRSLLEGSGTIVRDCICDPDGNTTTSGSGAQGDLGFAGDHPIPNGLAHFGAHCYDAASPLDPADSLNQPADMWQASR